MYPPGSNDPNNNEPGQSEPVPPPEQPAYNPPPAQGAYSPPPSQPPYNPPPAGPQPSQPPYGYTPPAQPQNQPPYSYPPPAQTPNWQPQPGQQPGYPGVYTEQVNGTTILVLGIVAFFCFGIVLGPIAWIMGNNALAAIDAGRADPSQRGTVVAGRICGMIATILSAIWIVTYAVLFATGMMHGLNNSGG